MGKDESKQGTQPTAQAVDTEATVDTMTGAAVIIAQANDFCENDLEAGELNNIPTIALSHQAEVCHKYFVDPDSNSDLGSLEGCERTAAASPPSSTVVVDNPVDNEKKKKTAKTITAKSPASKKRGRRNYSHLEPSAVALPVGSLLSREADAITRNNNNGNCTITQRAEFISATLIKPSPTTKLGLTFEVDGTIGFGFVIATISPTGLLGTSGAPFHVGDKVISVNHCSCDQMEHPSQATQLLESAPSEIIIVVQNRGGDPCVVETMITKPNPHHQAGIGFSCPDSLEQVNVSCLIVDGLFATSLLTIGDEVLSINAIPCGDLDSEAAADIIRSAPTYITIVARKFYGNGIVIAMNNNNEDDDNDKQQPFKWWYGTMIGTATTSEDYGRQERGFHMGCYALVCCLALTFLVLLIVALQLK